MPDMAQSWLERWVSVFGASGSGKTVRVLVQGTELHDGISVLWGTALETKSKLLVAAVGPTDLLEEIISAMRAAGLPDGVKRAANLVDIPRECVFLPIGHDAFGNKLRAQWVPFEEEEVGGDRGRKDDTDATDRLLGDVSESFEWCLGVFLERVKSGVRFALATREYPWTKASILMARLDDGAELPLRVCESKEIARKCGLHLTRALELAGTLPEGTTQLDLDSE